MRRPWIAVLALLVVRSARAGDDPAAPQPPKTYEFWTQDELQRIDRGLEVLNLDRKDLGFQKRPIDDPFRLEVVNRILDDPLSIGDEAEGWDRVARKGDAGRLLHKASGLLPPRHGSRWTNSPALTSQVVPEAVLEEIRGVLGACRASGGIVTDKLGLDAEKVLRKAYRTQVEAPPGTPQEMTDDAFLKAARAGDVPALCFWADLVLRQTEELVDALRAHPFEVPKEGLRYVTDSGVVVITGAGDDVHDEGDDVVLVIDVGGNDTWVRGASASGKRPVSVCIDLGGDDHWGTGRDLSCAGALGGIAVQWDAGKGSDVYTGGHCSCGAAIFGVSVLVDEGGDDVYRCKDFGCGAGAFGVGILLDKGGNDLYHADLYGEGFASTWGCGVLVDLAGNDVYDAGGVHDDAPLHRDRTQSLSQGFAIGMRPDASGGVGVLVDVAGNDRYLADIYGQGASYWFSLGLLIDDDGNDTYLCGHYGQGTGIHLSAGMLLDRAGQDLYYTQYGVGIGGAHDYSVGVLVDRGGDDHYCGSGGSQGGALTNSVARLVDDGGDDGYTAVHRGSSHGSAAPARDTGGIGLLLDAGGADVYSEPLKDGKVWTDGLVGAGIDDPTPPGAAPAADPMGAAITKEAATAAVDKDGRVAGPDGKPVDDLDKLWDVAKRWQVGDERVIGPIARARLVALGGPALERAVSRLGTKEGLEFEAAQALLKEFPREKVLPRVIEASHAKEVPTRKGALRILGTLADPAAETRLVEMLDDRDVRPFVLRALAALKKAPPEVAKYLTAAKEPEGVAAAVCLGAAGGGPAIAALVGALSPSTPFPVRTAAEEQLSHLGDAAVPALTTAAHDAKSVRERRSALRALGGTKSPRAAAPVIAALVDTDRWIRLSAHQAAERLLRDLAKDAPADLSSALEAQRARETDPLLQRLLR